MPPARVKILNSGDGCGDGGVTLASKNDDNNDFGDRFPVPKRVPIWESPRTRR